MTDERRPRLVASSRWVLMVMRDVEARPAAKTVAAVLGTQYMDWKTLGNARPSHATLVTACNLHETTVRNALDELVALGFLVKVNVGGMKRGQRVATTYAGRFPTGRPAPRQPPSRSRSSKPRDPVVPA